MYINNYYDYGEIFFFFSYTKLFRNAVTNCDKPKSDYTFDWVVATVYTKKSQLWTYMRRKASLDVVFSS